MISNLRSSFPTARTKAGKVTQVADTGAATAPIAGGLPGLIRPANPDRTYLTLRNIGTDLARYGYVSRASLNVDGMQLKPGDAVDVDSPGDIYIVSETASTVDFNWDEGTGA